MSKPATALEQRAEPRLAPSGAATATMYVLNADGSVGSPVPVVPVNFSGRGMRINAPQALPAGSLIRIDLEKALLLAEVCYSEKADGDRYALGLRLEHTLLQTESLERLRQRFAEEELVGWGGGGSAADRRVRR